MNSNLLQYIEERLNEFDQINERRKNDLKDISEYILSKGNDQEISLIFICTHNSRRSHISQIWTQVAAFKYGFKNVKTYSGGTEATHGSIRAASLDSGRGRDHSGIGHLRGHCAFPDEIVECSFASA